MNKIIKASAVTLLFIFISTFVLGFNSEIAHSPAGWDGAFLIAIVATIIGIFVLLLFGIPAHMLLDRKDYTSLFWYFLLGIVPGLAMVFVFHIFGDDVFYQKVLQSIPLSIFGGISASIFGFIVRRNTT